MPSGKQRGDDEVIAGGFEAEHRAQEQQRRHRVLAARRGLVEEGLRRPQHAISSTAVTPSGVTPDHPRESQTADKELTTDRRTVPITEFRIEEADGLTETFELEFGGEDHGRLVIAPAGDVRSTSAAMADQSTRFTRPDGVEKTRQITQPLLDAPPPVHSYPQGSGRPAAADEIVAGRPHTRWEAS
jgi:hypothetical protein